MNIDSFPTYNIAAHKSEIKPRLLLLWKCLSSHGYNFHLIKECIGAAFGETLPISCISIMKSRNQWEPIHSVHLSLALQVSVFCLCWSIKSLKVHYGGVEDIQSKHKQSRSNDMNDCYLTHCVFWYWMQQHEVWATKARWERIQCVLSQLTDSQVHFDPTSLHGCSLREKKSGDKDTF